MIKLWDEDIAFVRQARHFQERGYSVLMYDMRNHGDSDLGVCPWVSWGPEEARDVIAAVEFIATHPDHAEASIGLLSICMGASASTYAYGMGRKGLGQYEQIKAMVAVQPLHYREFVRAFGIPGFLDKAGAKVSLERTGIDLNTKTFIEDVESIAVPTLVIQNRNDPWTDLDFVQRYFDQLSVEKEILWLDLDEKRAAAYDWLGTAPEVVEQFFAKHM